MKQRFIVEIERPEGDPVDARWLLTGIQEWGRHMLKPEDVKVFAYEPPKRNFWDVGDLHERS
jgi:hypothetical protein